MDNTYYIDINGVKDGPLSLIAIMRRIRLGKITPKSLIYVNDSEATQLANSIDEIAIFFSDEPDDDTDTSAAPETTHQQMSITGLLARSWGFTMDNHIMTVFAGMIMLVNILLTVALINQFGVLFGAMIAWAICITCHNIYLIYILRLFRGQPLSSDFINRQFAPILPTLLAACLVLALMMGGGILLFVIPCLIVSILYIMVPFLIFDHQYGVIESMHASRLLLQKNNQQYMRLITILILGHYICLLLIIPIPITLPMFAASLAELYERLVSK